MEHIFGAQTNDMGGTLVRGIGPARAKARLGLKNLAYNTKRAGQLTGMGTPAPAKQTVIRCALEPFDGVAWVHSSPNTARN